MFGFVPPTAMVGSVLAHAVGHRPGPVPLGYALAAGGVALWASFDTLRLRWRRTRLDPRIGRPVPLRLEAIVDSRVLRWVIRLVGLVLTAAVVVLAWDSPGEANNPVLALVYVVFWVGLPVCSLLLGPVWRTLNPVRTTHLILARVLARDPRQGIFELPQRCGYWPAVVGLFSFAWLELVSPDRLNPRFVLTWWAGYAMLMLVGALLFGSRWFDRGDAFEVYSALVGLLAPWGRRWTDGRVVLRNPLHALAGLSPAPALPALVAVLLSATAFDAFSGTRWWRAVRADSDLPVLLGTIGLLSTVLLALGTFWAAGWLTGRLARRPRSKISQQSVHSLVPIAIGYVVAHYLTLLLSVGPDAIEQAVTALNPLAGEPTVAVMSSHAGHTMAVLPPPAAISAGWPGPVVSSFIGIGAVLAGHILGLIAAHDRLIHLLPDGRRGVIAQLPLLICMIGFTLAALTLLSAA